MQKPVRQRGFMLEPFRTKYMPAAGPQSGEFSGKPARTLPGGELLGRSVAGHQMTGVCLRDQPDPAFGLQLERIPRCQGEMN